MSIPLAQIARHRILVVEDDSDLRHMLAEHLQDLPAVVQCEQDGLAGLSAALGDSWDLILLDIQMPKKTGLEICQALRSKGITTPVVFLTSRADEVDRVLGLEYGADDYIVKPFSIKELQARVRAILRRASQYTVAVAGPQADIHTRHLKLSAKNRRAWLTDKEIELTTREFDLLWFFAAHQDQVFSREALLANVWGNGFDGLEHTVNSHINRLRNKLNLPLIQTVWGAGYRFNDGE